MELTKTVTYAGVLDPRRRNLDIIFKLPYGTSYNSFLVQGEQTALIDAVPDPFAKEFIERLKTLLHHDKVDYLILNHVSAGCRGSLLSLANKYPELQICVTASGKSMVQGLCNREMPIRVVQNGELLDLGQGHTLEFVVEPDGDAPEMMLTYLREQKILFSGKLFAAHICEPAICDRYMRGAVEFKEERYCYFETMFQRRKGVVRTVIQRLMEKSAGMICPYHGPVLEHYLRETVGYYHSWSIDIPAEREAAVFYVSAYGHTETMAKQLADEVRSEGIPLKMYNLMKKSPRELQEAINAAGGLLIGTPTIDKDAPKPIWDLISYAKEINLRGKPVIVFGSYGWSGEACRNVGERLKQLQAELIGENLRCMLKPSAEDRAEIKRAAGEFVRALRE